MKTANRSGASRDTSYHEFVQRVRRHRPSEILRMAAATSIQNHESDGLSPPVCWDFAIAAVSKAAICCGNEHRRPGVRHEDLRAMCSALIACRDPLLDDNDVAGFTVRAAFEQMPSQELPFRDLARTRALLEIAASEADQDFITPEFWKALLGCSIEEFVALAIFLHTRAVQNGGIFKRSWLAQQNFEPIFDFLPRDTIERVSRTHFILTREEFRAIADERAQEDSRLKRFEFNPLLVGPFVELPGQDPIAPVLYPILIRATPGSLYYTAACSDEGPKFTDALGKAFEHYVGMQLKLCNPIGLKSEITYNKNQNRSVDFVMVLPKVVVLVEAKVTRLTEAARLGTEKLESDFARAPGVAIQQIEKTAQLIRDEHASFKHIPNDRRIVGLIVTMEPYYLCASEVVFPTSGSSILTHLCSARDLEKLVVMEEPTCEELLLGSGNRLKGSENWSLSARLNTLQDNRNPLLDEIWKQYSFNQVESD